MDEVRIGEDHGVLKSINGSGKFKILIQLTAIKNKSKLLVSDFLSELCNYFGEFVAAELCVFGRVMRESNWEI